MEKGIGLTKGAGWQFGVRKSTSLNVNEVWDFLFSESGSKLWINGANNDFSTFKPYSHIRTKWKLKGWKNDAAFQLRVYSNKDKKVTIAFHIDKLLNENQREETKCYWNNRLNEIIQKLQERTKNS